MTYDWSTENKAPLSIQSQ